MTENKKRTRRPASERDQDELEISTMGLCKKLINRLRSGKARLRVAQFLLAAIDDKKEVDFAKPADPRQPDLPEMTREAAMRLSSADGEGPGNLP